MNASSCFLHHKDVFSTWDFVSIGNNGMVQEWNNSLASIKWDWKSTLCLKAHGACGKPLSYPFNVFSASWQCNWLTIKIKLRTLSCFTWRMYYDWGWFSSGISPADGTRRFLLLENVFVMHLTKKLHIRSFQNKMVKIGCDGFFPLFLRAPAIMLASPGHGTVTLFQRDWRGQWSKIKRKLKPAAFLKILSKIIWLGSGRSFIIYLNIQVV